MPDNQPDNAVDLNTVSMLIPKSKDGDGNAREELLALIQDYLARTAKTNMDPTLRQKLGESDIVQQSFIRVIEHFEKFKGSTSAEFHGWLKTIVINEIRNSRRGYRSIKRDVTRETPVGEDGRLAVDPQLTPSSEALRSEQTELFEKILGKLSPEHAQVIRMRNIDQYPFKEIAKRMDRSTDAVSKLWYRAMLKFEEHLKSTGNFESWQNTENPKTE